MKEEMSAAQKSWHEDFFILQKEYVENGFAAKLYHIDGFGGWLVSVRFGTKHHHGWIHDVWTGYIHILDSFEDSGRWKLLLGDYGRMTVENKEKMLEMIKKFLNR